MSSKVTSPSDSLRPSEFVRIEATGVGAPAEGASYVVQRGNSLWLIARQIYGQGTRYTAIYSVNRDQIRDPNKIYPGQLFKMPKS